MKWELAWPLARSRWLQKGECDGNLPNETSRNCAHILFMNPETEKAMSVQDLLEQIGQKRPGLFPLSPKAVRQLRSTEEERHAPKK